MNDSPYKKLQHDQSRASLKPAFGTPQIMNTARSNSSSLKKATYQRQKRIYNCLNEGLDVPPFQKGDRLVRHTENIQMEFDFQDLGRSLNVHFPKTIKSASDPSLGRALLVISDFVFSKSIFFEKILSSTSTQTSKVPFSGSENLFGNVTDSTELFDNSVIEKSSEAHDTDLTSLYQDADSRESKFYYSPYIQISYPVSIEINRSSPTLRISLTLVGDAKYPNQCEAVCQTDFVNTTPEKKEKKSLKLTFIHFNSEYIEIGSISSPVKLEESVGKVSSGGYTKNITQTTFKTRKAKSGAGNSNTDESEVKSEALDFERPSDITHGIEHKMNSQPGREKMPAILATDSDTSVSGIENPLHKNDKVLKHSDLNKDQRKGRDSYNDDNNNNCSAFKFEALMRKGGDYDVDNEHVIDNRMFHGDGMEVKDDNSTMITYSDPKNEVIQSLHDGKFNKRNTVHNKLETNKICDDDSSKYSYQPQHVEPSKNRTVTTAKSNDRSDLTSSPGDGISPAPVPLAKMEGLPIAPASKVGSDKLSVNKGRKSSSSSSKSLSTRYSEWSSKGACNTPRAEKTKKGSVRYGKIPDKSPKFLERPSKH